LTTRFVDQTLEQRIVEDEQRFRQVAHRALRDDSVVEVPEYGEQRIRVMAIAVPDVRNRVAGRAQLARLVGPELGLAMRDEALEERDSVEDRHIASPYPGQDQQILGPPCILCRHHHPIGVGFQKEYEKLLLDRVDRNAAVAHRPLDECADFILGIASRNW
jgi:hypothetical protein